MRVIKMKDHEVAKSGNWKVWAKRINGAWQKTTEGILETGALLIDAKADLPHGEFTNMVQLELNFSSPTARMLMAVAAHPVISNRYHGNVLPPSWRTLYELTKLPEPLLLEKLQDGTITPKTERREIMELRVISNEKKIPKKKPATKQKQEPEAASSKEAFIEELRQLSKEDQVEEIFSVLKELQLTFADFGVHTMTIGRKK